MKTVVYKLFVTMNGPLMMKQQENCALELSGMPIKGVKMTELALCGDVVPVLVTQPAVDWLDDSKSQSV